MTSTSNESRPNEEADKDDHAIQPQGDVQFRSKRRSRKARTKLQVKEDYDKAEDNEQPEMTVSEMTILKEAQELREQSRMAALTAKGGDQRSKMRDAEEATEEADDPIGLKQSFAVEKSSHIAEERMSRYIEEHMPERFKDKYKEEDSRRSKNEDDVFAIPDRLKVEEKPLYDPGEGLPAAGVEEVALPDEVRMRNEAETRKAHREALSKRGGMASKHVTHIPGNLSANFAKHRSEWMQGNIARSGDGDSGHRTEDAQDKQGRSVGEDTAKRRRYETASDAAFADRFRKRWKR